VRLPPNKTKLVCMIGPASESPENMLTRIAAVSPEEQTCHGLQFSYGVSPIHMPEHAGDWSAFARRWVRNEGLAEGLVVLTEGPSQDNPEANPRLEIFDLRHRRHRQGRALAAWRQNDGD
jgi:pyruvate kinase